MPRQGRSSETWNHRRNGSRATWDSDPWDSDPWDSLGTPTMWQVTVGKLFDAFSSGKAPEKTSTDKRSAPIDRTKKVQELKADVDFHRLLNLLLPFFYSEIGS